MSFVNPTGHALIVNQQDSQFAYSHQQKKPSAEITNAQFLSVDYLKSGSENTKSQADDLLTRANAFSELPQKVRHSLQAYKALELSEQRETIRNLMGIDFYA